VPLRSTVSFTVPAILITSYDSPRLTGRAFR
jgi:hypothetical protein